MTDHVERLLQMSDSEKSACLYECARNISRVQEDTLLDILDLAKDTEIGRKYGFAGTGSAEEYRKRVPVTEYADYKPMIDRIYEGERDILFPGEPVSFVFSSGTTGDAKTFPESEKGDRVKKIISSLRSFQIGRLLEGKRKSGFKVFTITNTSNYGTNPHGIPVGTASGIALTQTGAASKLLSVPYAFSQIGYLPAEQQNYGFAFFALSDRDVVELVCNNPAHFVKVFEIINTRFSDLASDISNGSISIDISDEDRKKLGEVIKPDPARAEELRKIHDRNGCLRVQDFWPDFVCVGCWLSGSVGRIAREYTDIFPEGTCFIHWGYGASEAKIDVPDEINSPRGIPALFGVFMELKDIKSGKILLAGEAECGKLYELVITTYSGLYRYNLHDLVKFSEDPDGIRRIEFICKSKDKITIQGKDLYAGELTVLIEDYEKDTKERIRLFQGKAENDALTLFVEPVDFLDIDRFTGFMRERLDGSGIPLAAVSIYEKGYRNSLYGKVVQGKSVSSTKLPVFL